jgi:hypothetical protein
MTGFRITGFKKTRNLLVLQTSQNKVRLYVYLEVLLKQNFMTGIKLWLIFLHLNTSLEDSFNSRNFSSIILIAVYIFKQKSGILGGVKPNFYFINKGIYECAGAGCLLH